VFTIDADRKVADVKALTIESIPSASHMLEVTALVNGRRWTFAKPPSAPHRQSIVYDYEIDASAPLDRPSKVAFDLPERVMIVGSARSVNKNRSKEKN